MLWSDLRDVLKGAGVSDDTVEIVRRATAPARHQARVQAALDAARTWLKKLFPTQEPPGSWVKALCALEAQGLYGGGFNHPGAGTTRHPAFSNLGKGRRQASDGGAWTAAIEQAGGQGWHIALGETGLGLYFPHEEDFVPIDAILSPEEYRTVLLRLLQEEAILYRLAPGEGLGEAISREETVVILAKALDALASKAKATAEAVA